MLFSSAQVIKFVLEAIETVVKSDDAWLLDVLGDVLDVVVVYLHFGLQGWQHKTPSRLFPQPGAQWEPPPAPNIKVNIVFKVISLHVVFEVLPFTEYKKLQVDYTS